MAIAILQKSRFVLFKVLPGEVAQSTLAGIWVSKPRKAHQNGLGVAYADSLVVCDSLNTSSFQLTDLTCLYKSLGVGMLPSNRIPCGGPCCLSQACCISSCPWSHVSTLPTLHKGKSTSEIECRAGRDSIGVRWTRRWVQPAQWPKYL